MDSLGVLVCLFCFVSIIFSYLELTVLMRNLALIISDYRSLSKGSLNKSDTKDGWFKSTSSNSTN